MRSCKTFRYFHIIVRALSILAIAAVPTLAESPARAEGLIRVDANPERGFRYPYYLLVPSGLLNSHVGDSTALLVLPNNTGTSDDDFKAHDESARGLASKDALEFASDLKVPALVPVFPRPRTDWRIYTHALGRSALLTDKPELRRFDLQLIAMIDDARSRLRAEGLSVSPRVMMFGFSAAAMFTNRFAMLHPERVAAAAFGSPGGWALAPVATWKGRRLRYPVGIADLKTVSGAKFQRRRARKVPLFLFAGAADTNDSVVNGDSYEEPDRDLIFKLFGKTPAERWPITEQMYAANLPRAVLKLYPNVAHDLTDGMWSEVEAFFRQHLHD